jgi:hypothetical protein
MNADKIILEKNRLGHRAGLPFVGPSMHLLSHGNPCANI